MTKTTQFLLVLHQLASSPKRCLSESQLKGLLGHPPKSTWHRLINELTTGTCDLPALLMETMDRECEQKFYCLNQRGWQTFVDAHEEGRFLLECYRQVGFLLNSNFTDMVFELPDLNQRQRNRIERKFLHLVKVRAQASATSKKILSAVIEALIAEKQLELTYDGGLRYVRPLTLCQYRDELYLMCYRLKGEGLWEQRTYKLARISGIKILDRGFPYPNKLEWNPVDLFQDSSGLVLGHPRRVLIRVHGLSRRIIAEKDFFGGELTNRTADADTYHCTFTNSAEFLGQIFVYAQDIEIVDDDELRREFVAKAQAALRRNQNLRSA